MMKVKNVNQFSAVLFHFKYYVCVSKVVKLFSLIFGNYHTVKITVRCDDVSSHAFYVELYAISDSQSYFQNKFL